MNIEIIAPTNNVTTSTLNWLLAIDTQAPPSAMEAELPRAYWQTNLHPVASYGEVATLHGCISTPFEDGPTISVTFTSDARISSVELCFSFDGRQQLRAALAVIAKEFDTGCTPIPPAFGTLAAIPNDSRQLEESWWRGESFIYQMIGIQLLVEPSLQHGAWNRPHEILVRKFPIATLDAPACDPISLAQIMETSRQRSPSLPCLVGQREGNQETPTPVDLGVSLAATA